MKNSDPFDDDEESFRTRVAQKLDSFYFYYIEGNFIAFGGVALIVIMLYFVFSIDQNAVIASR